jgi:DNA primase
MEAESGGEESMRGGGWDLDEIRRRADLVELISPHVRLRKAGRRLTGLCPFHQERTPSFSVDPETGLWYCFGCKVGGDVFRFVEMTEKVSFQDAVELLARRLGIQPRTPVAASQARAKERLLALHDRAARFFNTTLKGRAGSAVRDYLKNRGVSESSVETFLLGYAPDQWDALLTAMDKHGFSGKELGRAGLAIQRDDGGFYDRFRNRLIFPIRDATGRVIAFGGRALADDQQPKYLNSPETALFQKGETLWAFDLARRAMSDKGRAIVVEGYMDAIACHEVGFAETVATMGTALTSRHVDLLRRRTERLVLAFDSDSAGLAAALRSSEFFRQAEVEVRVTTLPEGMDPDNVIRTKAAAAFGEIVEAAVPMLEWELGRALARGQDGRERMTALRDAVAILARVPPGVEREYYIGWLAKATASGGPSQLRTTDAAIREELARQAPRRDQRARRTEEVPLAPEAPPGPGAGSSPRGRLTASVLAALLHHGELAGQFLPMLERADFPTAEQQAVFDAIAALVGRSEPVSVEAVLAEVEAEATALLAQLSLDEVAQEQVEFHLRGGIRRIAEVRLERRQRLLTQRLRAATSGPEQRAIRAELAEVSAQRRQLVEQMRG